MRTRQGILDAAIRVFAREGPDAARIDDIIAEAQVARGTFYNYFTTRDEILLAVAEDISDRLIHRMAARRAHPDPAERVGAAIRSFIRLAADDPNAGWVIVRTALLAAPIGERMREGVAADALDGIASGRFKVPSAQVACDVMLGLGLMGMRSVLRQEAGSNHAEHIAEVVLRALGVADAADIAQRPLEDLLPP